jgi:antitoxin component HigA of HigAB toxin-antitoxin module
MSHKTDTNDVKKANLDRMAYLHVLRAKLFIVGKKINDIARETGYDPSMVSHVLRGRRYNRKIIDYVEKLPYPKARVN